MRSRDLEPYVPPPPPPKPTCKACKSFQPDCLMPHGDGAIDLCWPCAHQILEHGYSLEHAHGGRCKCPPSDIYPMKVLETRVHTFGSTALGSVRVAKR